MKTAQVNKLYSMLTPLEQASLAIGALARQDIAELEAITDSVERLTYRSLHADYRQRVDGYYTLGGFYGIQYWKTRAMMLTAFNLSRDDGSVNHKCIEMGKQLMVQLVSMDAALRVVCELLKIDVEAVQTLADCEDVPGFADPEPALVDEYITSFTKLAGVEVHH
jgi:hypothetical protein